MVDPAPQDAAAQDAVSDRITAVEERIINTPAQGIVRLAVKLRLQMAYDGHDREALAEACGLDDWLLLAVTDDANRLARWGQPSA